MKRQVYATIGAVAAAGALVAMGGVGAAGAADSDIYDITTTAGSATIELTPRGLQVCNAPVIVSGTYAGTVDPDSIVWSGSDQLLSHDPALSDTFRFSGVAQMFPEYFTPRSVTVDLAPGTYTILGQCTPYDTDGNYAGDDTDETAVFTVSAPDTGEPTDPGDGGAWGSVGSLLPF